MRIEPLDGPLGARVREVDLRKGLTAAQRRALQRAIDTHGILILPGQDIDDEAQVAFSRTFGELETPRAIDHRADTHHLVTRLADVDDNDQVMAPESHHVTYMKGNQLWHSDSSFKAVPAKYSILHAREVPEHGGETDFADCRDAYDAWCAQGRNPDERVLDTLVCEHSIVWSQSRVIGDYFTASEKATMPPVPQRLVRTHPGSGRKSFYAGAHAARILDWPLAEGRALIDTINAFCVKPSRVYTHFWTDQDLVIWDNRRVLHRGRPHDPTQRRIMHRTTVRGDAPPAQ